MSTDQEQPATEAIVGAPLQIREEDGERVVGYRVEGGRFKQLKRLDERG
jgi:hypothetical protein